MGVINVDTSIAGRLTADEGKLLVMAEHFDKFIVDWQMKHPSVWRDRLPKGVFSLYQGASQKTNIFRGTLGPQSGLSEWDSITPSSKPTDADPSGVDYCSYKPQTYSWAYESIDFTGYRTSWRSPAFCVNDLKYIDKAKEQLGMIIRAGSQITDQVKETFSRESYVKDAVDAGKGVILCEGGMDYVDDSSVRFSYNPFVVNSDNETYITFADTLLPKISTLNWDFLDYIRTYMSDQCPDAAMSSQGGMPIFGLMIDILDFEKYVLANDNLREDFRYARPEQLIKGFDMGFKVYRGFALIHDPRQMRFIVKNITSNTVYAKRVNPRKATRAGTVGYVPETNTEYLRAELGIGVIFMSDVIQILVPPVVNNMSSGMTFGPAPGFNGEWSWLNIKDPDTNPLGEIGYFFSRYEYFVKPLQYATEAVVFLYRRCPQELSTGCVVEDQSSAVTSAFPSVIPASGDFDATNRTVVLTLASTLTVGVGAQVNITKDDSNVFPAFVAASDDAPTYTFTWESGASNVPSAVTEMNDITITKVTVA